MAVSGIVKIDVFGAPEKPTDPDVDHGSGFVLTADGYVETAAHLFLPSFHVQRIQGRLANVLRVEDDQANTFPLTLIKIDYGLDVALLKFVGFPNGMRALPISTHPVRFQDTLYVFGFPGGQNTATAYPATFESALTSHRFQFQGISNVGNSGGPLLDSDGYVVGLDGDAQNTILTSPVTGTYKAVPAKDFLRPEGFDSLAVRPLFFRKDNENDPLVTKTYPKWTEGNISSVITAATGDLQPRACNMAINRDWRLVKLDVGFLIAPPAGSALADAQFQMSLSTAKLPQYILSTGEYISSHRYVSVPYYNLPLEEVSLLLMNPSDIREMHHPAKDIAFELHALFGRGQSVRAGRSAASMSLHLYN